MPQILKIREDGRVGAIRPGKIVLLVNQEDCVYRSSHCVPPEECYFFSRRVMPDLEEDDIICCVGPITG